MKKMIFKENYDDFQFLKIEYYCDGMNIEIKKYLYIFLEKTEVDIII